MNFQHAWLFSIVYSPSLSFFTNFINWKEKKDHLGNLQDSMEFNMKILLTIDSELIFYIFREIYDLRSLRKVFKYR